MDEYINLVNSQGQRVGSIEKLQAHIEGKLHEAFSIFVFNQQGQLLLQKRALHKYHSAGLWTNTCCSHASVGETLNQAIHRRLVQEMGFDCPLKEIATFSYKTTNLANNLIENEFDHIFIGTVNHIKVVPNPNEVCQYQWQTLDFIKKDIIKNPDIYTSWFKIIISRNLI